ncbi:unnamed protein product [Acanthoscelides obtectus]|uniref:Protein SMG7 n=1 Tax=Acanthoscelides obtectus TaxID=200917 RepID=A0A9P0NYZ1_ACAOB|nr:unnamed protein product [Acanthoscelides obtectus]CAK1632113.1 Protein SMG7 [Acanthoscelides obtectus]
MGYKKAVQILKQADELKSKLTKKCDWLNSNEEWIMLQQLQNFYYQLLVMDLEYALDKKVEQDLWSVGFRNVITCLQESACDSKNSSRASYQALLMYSLESASGFFITLLQELCNAFDMDLPFRRRGNFYGQMIPSCEINMPHITSCLYICQYCLVHLGDIARYRNQRKQAETFYKQAIQISPSSGHPYNQLALLEASQNNKLATVYYYIRSIAVKNPFPASCTNLANTLNSAIDKDSFSEKCQTKITTNEFIQLFLCTHGYLHLHTELKQAEMFMKRLNSIMTALVATQSFTGDMLVKIAAINLFAIKHVDENKPDGKRVRELVLELIAGFLCALLVPIHTLNVDEGLLNYYALPAVKIVLYYVQHNSGILKERPFTQKLLIWPSLVKLVNGVQKYLKGINLSKYATYPLPEDKSLEGFVPLAKAFEELNFSEVIKDLKIEKLLRLNRITNIAKWLTEVDVNGNKLIVRTQNNKEVSFEPGLVQPDPTDTLLEEMKSLHIGGSEQVPKSEKKSGILKPQGSLEKSREEKEIPVVSAADLNSANGSNNKIEKNRKGKQNIALQSIFKKMEETNKQVKFSVDEPEKDRNIHVPLQEQLHQPPPPLPIHTQPFGHRSSSFSLPLTEPDINFLKPFNKENTYSAPENPILGPNVNIPPPVLPPYSKPTQQIFPQNNPPKGAYDTLSMPMPYQNVPYNYPFNIWRQEEPQTSLNVQHWWGNTRQQQMPPNCRPPQGFQAYQQTPVNNRPAVPPQTIMPQLSNSQGSGDVFSMPWNNYQNPHLRTFMGPEGTSNQNISVRQAMLKEGNLPLPSQPEDSMDRMNNLSTAEKNYVQNPINMPGYSLFNTNSWTPNLGGQLIGNKHPEDKTSHLNHHSLFRDHEPKSLAQLLEHQQNQNK